MFSKKSMIIFHKFKVMDLSLRFRSGASTPLSDLNLSVRVA